MTEESHAFNGRARRARVLLAGAVALASCIPRQPADGPPRYPAGAALGSAKMTLVDPAAGASLASDDGVLTIDVPAGAVSTPTEFSVQRIVNTAPGIGTSYRIGPVGVSFTQLVTLTFRPAFAGLPVAGLSVMTRDPVTGYWTAVQQNLVVDAVAGTLTVTVTSFAVSDWSLVAAATANDFFGTFSLSESLEYSLSATGAANLAYAGSSGDVRWYVVPGSITLSSASVTGTTVTCTAIPASVPLPTSVAELNLVRGRFDFGINGRWDTTCDDSVPRVVAATFDTLGVNLNYCALSWLSTPLVASDHLQGSMTASCGTLGSATASWDFRTCPGVDGASCPPSDCHTYAAISCATGGPICNDTTVAADGTPCGSGGSCLAGVCR